MGHKDKASTNYSGGDSPKRLYLSPSTRTISPGIKVLPYAIAIFGVAFLVSAITASIVTPVQNSDAISTVSLDDTPVAYYVNIASATNGTAGVISKDIYATALGTLGVIQDALRITSNTPNGYKVYVSMANNANGSRLVNTSDNTRYLNPIQGNGVVDSSSPASLSNPGTLSTANTWGVAVASSWNSNFDNASAYASDSAITQATKFAPVPAVGHEELLITQPDTTTSSAQTDNITVYYGYHATSALPSGTYQNTVLYTAYAEATDQAGGLALFEGDLDYKNGGQIDITTSLYTDRTIKADEVSVTVIDNNEAKTCTIANDAAISKSNPGTNDSVTITCTAPAVRKPGSYTIKVDIPGYAHHSQGAIFYDTDGLTATLAGDSEPTTITTMQEMTTSICDAWDEVEDPDNYDTANHAPYTFTNKNNPNYPVRKYGRDLSLDEVFTKDEAVASWSTLFQTTLANSGPSITNINTDVPETFLKDTRDGNYYRVRKLAYGGCWMSENLRLVFDRDGVNSVGVIGANGSIMAQTPVVEINETNSNVGISAVGGAPASSFNASDFASSLAYTETAANKTRWSGESGVKHSTSTTDCPGDNIDCSNISMEYSRSYYEDATHTSSWGGEIVKGTVLYNWKTATAGTGDATNTDRYDSICPKGWQLPRFTGEKSFRGLIIGAYGGGRYDANNPTSNPYGSSDGNVETDAYQNVPGARVLSMLQTLRGAPLSFVERGVYNNSDASVTRVTYSAYTSQSKENAGYKMYYISFNNSYLRTLDANSQKGRGYGVRCVSQ